VSSISGSGYFIGWHAYESHPTVRYKPTWRRPSRAEEVKWRLLDTPQTISQTANQAQQVAVAKTYSRQLALGGGNAIAP